MNILFTYDYGADKRALIEDMGHVVSFHDEKDIANYPNKEAVEILICYNPFKAIDLKEFTSLKYILLSSIGFDQLPKAEVKKLGITVCNNKGGYSIPMGEWIVMKLLEMFKHSRALYKNQEKHQWFMDTSILELYQKRVLFFGTGTIAREAAKRLQGFDMTVVGLNTSGHPSEYFDLCYPLSHSVEEVKKADAVVIAMPHTEKTKRLFNQEHIDGLKSDAVLINIARGEIIDENYLIEALKRNQFKAAALDVFHQEPLPEDHPFWEMDNVIVTCHNSWISEMRNQRRFDIIFENLKRLKHQEPLLNVIDIERGY